MKENSIEEDMKNAEHFIKSIKTDKEYKEENGWHGYYNKEIVELARILEHILSDYKRVLQENEYMHNELDKQQTKINKYAKENEELKEDRDKFKKALGKRITYCNELEKDLFENCSNYVIPKQIVKDKIKELNRKINNGGKTYGRYGGCVINSENIMKLQNQIEALKELLEGRR